MSTVTVRPNATVSNGDSLLTGASRHAALADDSDATFIELTGPNPCVLEFPDPTPPGGETVLSWQLNLRAAGGVVSTSLLIGVEADTEINPGGTPATQISGEQTIVWGSPTTSRAVLDGTIATTPTGLTLSLAQGSTAPIAPIVYEAYLVVRYVEAPTVAVGQPTGTIATNLPEIAWLFFIDFDQEVLDLTPKAGAGAYGMTAFEVKVFDEGTYSDGGFDANTSWPAAYSGVVTAVSATQTVLGPGSSWQVENVLPNETYKAYVRIRQWNGTWSAWDDGPAFTIDADLPHTPSIHAVGDGANARNAIAVSEGDDGDVASHYIIVERSTDGGETFEPIRTEVGGGAVLPSDYY